MDPDLPLVEALQAGDDSALEELIKRHRESLFRFILRYVQDEMVSRDVLQEVFVRAYLKARSFEPRATVKTWLFTIALNLCRDRARMLTRRPVELSLDAPVRETTLGSRVADPSPGPDEKTVAREEIDRLECAIAQLPQQLREPLILFALEERPQKEVAEILAITPKAVETRVYQAKAKLRTLLGEGTAPGPGVIRM